MITPRATLLLVAVLVGGACSTDGVRTPLTPLAGAGNDSRPILTRLQAGETAVVDHASIGCWSRRRARIVFTGGSPVVIPWTELDFSSEEPLETRRGSLTHHDASRLDATVR